MADQEASTDKKEQDKKTDKVREEMSSTLSEENKHVKEMTREQLEALRFKLQKKFH